jgi:hypothetical protein
MKRVEDFMFCDFFCKKSRASGSIVCGGGDLFAAFFRRIMRGA